jgi:hypothetical protein
MLRGWPELENIGMSPTEKEEFGSPVRGLNDGETVEWSQNPGVIITTLLRNGCIPILVLLMMPIVLDSFVQASPASLLIIVVIYNAIAPPVLLLLFLYVVYFLVRTKSTTYYLTSQRLLEVQGRSIKKEIPRVNLQDIPPDQYLKSVSAQKQEANEFYDIYVTDSISGVVVRMTAMDGKVTDIIEKWTKQRRR